MLADHGLRWSLPNLCYSTYKESPVPTLISETNVALEQSDLANRIVLTRTVGLNGRIVPPARSPGLHLSGLIKYCAEKTKITAYVKDAEEEYAIERGHMPLRWALGHAWEEFAASLYPEMIWQPGEVSDPVVMTCDGVVEPSVNNFIIEEFKFSRGKYVKGPDLLKRWVWMRQGEGYCLGYGPRHVRWNVCWCMNWPDPVYVRYLVRFEEKEIAEMARMIEVNRAGAIEAGYGE
jgi:hypothetical protein